LAADNDRRFCLGFRPNSAYWSSQQDTNLQGFEETNAYNAMKVTFGTIINGILLGGYCAEKGGNFAIFSLE
jgi:hypothetical protein